MTTDPKGLAERIRRGSRDLDVIELCEWVLGHSCRGSIKMRFDKRAYQREYMRMYRQRRKTSEGSV